MWYSPPLLANNLPSLAQTNVVKKKRKKKKVTDTEAGYTQDILRIYYTEDILIWTERNEHNGMVNILKNPKFILKKYCAH